MTLRMFRATLLVLLLFPALLSAVSPEIQKMVGQAFAETKTENMERLLQKAAEKASAPDDRKYVYTALASLHERSGNFDQAFEQYQAAALAQPGNRDDSLFLDAARCAMITNNTDKAGEIVQSVLVTSFDDALLLRARLYSAWIELASGNRKNALAMLKSFAQNDVFEPYRPALLFTLWWSAGDVEAGKSLQTRYPKSPEAAAVRGDMLVGPSPFWYLMSRDGLAAFAVPELTSSDTATPAVSKEPERVISETPVVSGKPVEGSVWQQTGFFKNRENAESLAEVLRQRGFSPVVREEKRPSGTVYFAVLVPDDGTTANRLKEAGFESYSVRD